jgi:hypothetical protein
VGVHRDCSAHWEGRSIDFYWTADGSTDETKRALEEKSQTLCALPVDKALKGGNGHKGAKVIRGQRSEEGNLIRYRRCASVRVRRRFIACGHARQPV